MLCHSVRSWRSPVPLSFQRIIGCHGEAAERSAARGVFQFRVPAKTADENYFVNGLCHTAPVLPLLSPCGTSQFAGFRLSAFVASLVLGKSFTTLSKASSAGCVLVLFGEGEAFLVKGGLSFIVLRILLQEDIVLDNSLIELFLVEKCLAP